MTAAVPPKKSDLPARTLSAVVMVAVAGSALWLGGWVWGLFVLAVAAGVLWEWVKLANAITPRFRARALWLVGGVVYIGVAALALSITRRWPLGLSWVAAVVGVVVATDIGAYFTGRTFGGPKIAPKISPSKTWSGLIGGMVAAAAVMCAVNYEWRWSTCNAQADPLFAAKCWQLARGWAPLEYGAAVIVGALAAIIAQAGDFFESWMKRRAGVKDSGRLLPGHGGLFDRADGILAVSFVVGLLMMSHSL